jgi:putative nucleotidyltransferase with HDIG domain
MNREEALIEVRNNVKNERIIKHMLAVEVIMEHLANFFGEDSALWGMVGLLHDIDYEHVKGDMDKHTFLVEKILGESVDHKIIKAIKAHNYEKTGITPESKMEKMLISADAVSGLIIACALVMPSKKLSEVRVETILKKFKDRDFARGSDRDRITMFESIGLKKEKLFEISLKALQDISSELGL